MEDRREKRDTGEGSKNQSRRNTAGKRIWRFFKNRKLDTKLLPLSTIARIYHLYPDVCKRQYKHHLGDFLGRDQLEHAEEWLLFPENLGSKLSIDEIALSNGELYTIITNKTAKGKKGALVAIIKGTKASVVKEVLYKLRGKQRYELIKECTIGMANNMHCIVRECFPNTGIANDRFHIQQLVSHALQDIRIKLRWEALDRENEASAEAKKKGLKYKPPVYSNGDTEKQLLARSRYLLFKPRSKWTGGQKERSEILFKEFPQLKEVYDLSMMFRSFYQYSKDKEEEREIGGLV